MNVTNIPTTLYKTKWRRKQRPLPIFLIHINTHLITMLMTSGGMVSHRTYNVHQQALLLRITALFLYVYRKIEMQSSEIIPVLS